jgi:(S)-mandelate dehydrogenase
LPANDQAVTLDLIKRAGVAGVRVLVATLDAPVRSKRPRDLRNGLVVPFRPTPKTILDVALSPSWLLALATAGTPAFRNMERYVEQPATLASTAGFVQSQIKGTFSWDVLKRMRDAWPGALVVKGVMHPDDAEMAIAAGMDGILVSNHGGRQFDAAPATIDVLPAIVASVGSRTCSTAASAQALTLHAPSHSAPAAHLPAALSFSASVRSASEAPPMWPDC